MEAYTSEIHLIYHDKIYWWTGYFSLVANLPVSEKIRTCYYHALTHRRMDCLTINRVLLSEIECTQCHDDVFKWKHFPRYWAFVRGIHRSLVNSPHKGQWRGTLMFFFICAWGNGWVNNSEAGDLRHHRTYHDVTAMAAFPLVEFHRLQRQRACKYVNPGCLRSL